MQTQCSTYRTRIDSLTAQLHDSTLERTRLTHVVEDLQEQLRIANSKIGERKALEDSLAFLEETNEILRREVDALRSTLDSSEQDHIDKQLTYDKMQEDFLLQLHQMQAQSLELS